VPKHRIRYGIPVSARLIDRSIVQSVARPDLHILWRDEELADPHVLEIDLAYRGRRAIKSDDFDKGRPFCIDVGVPIIDLLEKFFDPKEAPSPKVEVMGTTLRIGPDLLRRRQTMTFVVLTDGPCARLSHVNPLDVTVEVEPVAEYQSRLDAGEISGQRWWNMPRLVVTWAVVLFIVFYIATEPDGAAGFIHAFADGLHSAANSMAKFINSL
jgi:hypothetical protein